MNRVCDVCGNTYDKPMKIDYLGAEHVFDSFECAIHALAPQCFHCGCRILGHGVESSRNIFCCAHCARNMGQLDMKDRD